MCSKTPTDWLTDQQVYYCRRWFSDNQHTNTDSWQPVLTHPLADVTVPANNARVYPRVRPDDGSAQNCRTFYTDAVFDDYVRSNRHVRTDATTFTDPCRRILKQISKLMSPGTFTVKVMSICIPPICETSLRRSGTARIVKGYQFYLHTLRFICKQNEPYLPLPSQPQMVLIYRPRRMEGWVDLGAKW